MQHAPISRARYMQENRKMRFQEAYDGWSQGRLTQAEAALLLGQCERSFRRHIERFEDDADSDETSTVGFCRCGRFSHESY